MNKNMTTFNIFAYFYAWDLWYHMSFNMLYLVEPSTAALEYEIVKEKQKK